VTENTLDTTIHEAAADADEGQMLQFALDRSRATFAWKCGGLDAAALHRAHPPSAMTLGNLLKHLAMVEDWTATRLAHAGTVALGGLGRRPGIPVALGR